MASVEYFLKIDTIKGGSKADKHKDEIEIQSFSWGASQSGSFAAGGGGGAGKVAMQDFRFTMQTNVASPALFLACASGEHLPHAILTCRKEQQELLKVTMSNVLVSAFQTGGQGGGDLSPSDQISLDFAKIEFEYKERDKSGQVTGSLKRWFDLKTFKGGSGEQVQGINPRRPTR